VSCLTFRCRTSSFSCCPSVQANLFAARIQLDASVFPPKWPCPPGPFSPHSLMPLYTEVILLKLAAHCRVLRFNQIFPSHPCTVVFPRSLRTNRSCFVPRNHRSHRPLPMLRGRVAGLIASFRPLRMATCLFSRLHESCLISLHAPFPLLVFCCGFCVLTSCWAKFCQRSCLAYFLFQPAVALDPEQPADPPRAKGRCIRSSEGSMSVSCIEKTCPFPQNLVVRYFR